MCVCMCVCVCVCVDGIVLEEIGNRILSRGFFRNFIF